MTKLLLAVVCVLLGAAGSSRADSSGKEHFLRGAEICLRRIMPVSNAMIQPPKGQRLWVTARAISHDAAGKEVATVNVDLWSRLTTMQQQQLVQAYNDGESTLHVSRGLPPPQPVAAP